MIKTAGLLKWAELIYYALVETVHGLQTNNVGGCTTNAHRMQMLQQTTTVKNLSQM